MEWDCLEEENNFGDSNDKPSKRMKTSQETMHQIEDDGRTTKRATLEINASKRRTRATPTRESKCRKLVSDFGLLSSEMKHDDHQSLHLSDVTKDKRACVAVWQKHIRTFRVQQHMQMRAIRQHD